MGTWVKMFGAVALWKLVDFRTLREGSGCDFVVSKAMFQPFSIPATNKEIRTQLAWHGCCSADLQAEVQISAVRLPLEYADGPHTELRLLVTLKNM